MECLPPGLCRIQIMCQRHLAKGQGLGIDSHWLLVHISVQVHPVGSEELRWATISFLRLRDTFP